MCCLVLVIVELGRSLQQRTSFIESYAYVLCQLYFITDGKMVV